MNFLAPGSDSLPAPLLCLIGAIAAAAVVGSVVWGLRRTRSAASDNDEDLENEELE